MREAKSYLGVATVAVVALSVVFGGELGRALGSSVGLFDGGLFAATAGFGLFAYRERRDPTLLLVGGGAAALIVYQVLVAFVVEAQGATVDGWIFQVWRFSTVPGLLVLVANLLVVVPWVERRGRPPLAPTVVVGASVAGLVGFDALALVTDASTALQRISFAALLIAGAIVMVRSLRWGGRFGWVAAAGLSSSLFGGVALLSMTASGDQTWTEVYRVTDVAPTLIAASLVVFVLSSLHLETSRMRRASDRAEEVLTGRAEIAAMVAHDVRGPLGTMKGLATTIRKSYEQLGDEERLEFIGMIERESARLLAQVDHIALALRVDARTLDMQLRPQPLASLVRQAVEVVDHPPHPIDVDAPDTVAARADAKWLPVAIGEGIENAARYSPPEAPILITLRATDVHAIVEITDEGPGIPVERRDEVFQRFARWRPPGYEDRPGSGLGLFICRGIAREHGGDASLVDGPGGGTILRIRLPLEGTGSE